MLDVEEKWEFFIPVIFVNFDDDNNLKQHTEQHISRKITDEIFRMGTKLKTLRTQNVK